MNKKTVMPVYVGEYLSDTGHMTAQGNGVYLLLLFHSWQRGGLPADLSECYQIIKAGTQEEREEVDAVVREFFVEADGRFICKRSYLAENRMKRRRKSSKV